MRKNKNSKFEIKMEQAIQQEKEPAQAEKPQIAQPHAEKTEQLDQPKKKSKWWLWLILVLVVLGAAVGIYFWLF